MISHWGQMIRILGVQWAPKGVSSNRHLAHGADQEKVPVVKSWAC